MQLAQTSERASARARSIETRLARFGGAVRTRATALASRHPWIADLALSFPALLVALAWPRRGQNAREAQHLIVAGAPLAAAALQVDLPIWTRALPPEAFHAPVPPLPDTLDVRRQILNHVPKSWNKAPNWLENVSLGYSWGDADLAIWCAREAPPRLKRRRGWRKRYADNRRLVCLWAWFTQRPDELASALSETRWTPAMQWKAAQDAAIAWRERVCARLYLGDEGVADTWLKDAVVGGYSFTALTTLADIHAEGEQMQHCVGGYGASIACNQTRIFSVRRDGARIATLALEPAHGGSPFPNIVELSGPRNAQVDIDVWLAARRWLHEQDQSIASAERITYRSAQLNGRAWRALWRPYWLAKRRIPRELSLTASEDALYSL